MTLLVGGIDLIKIIILDFERELTLDIAVDNDHLTTLKIWG